MLDMIACWHQYSLSDYSQKSLLGPNLFFCRVVHNEKEARAMVKDRLRRPIRSKGTFLVDKFLTPTIALLFSLLQRRSRRRETPQRCRRALCTSAARAAAEAATFEVT